MVRVIWTDKETNIEVLTLVKEERSMLSTRNSNWMGHILRGQSPLRDVMEGRMEGRRTRGRSRVGMIDDLTEGNSCETLKRKAQDRAGWRSWTPGTCLTAGYY